MRRAEIIAGIKNVLNAIQESGLRELLATPRDRSGADPNFAMALMKSFKKYSHHAVTFGQVEREMVEILRLDVLDEPEVWFQAITDPAETLRELFSRLRFAGPQLEKFLALLETDATKIAEESARATIEHVSSSATISALILEEKNHFSSPERLIKVLRSISLLYEAVAILKNSSPSTLSVVGCDSGSDKSFDFLGLASVIDGVKEILIAAWDRIVFYRERKIEARLELINKSLPIIEQISAMEDQRAIGPEQAEILRRRVTEGVTLFVEAGVVIPEISQRSSYNPRHLLAPEPKLLVAAGIPDREASPGASISPVRGGLTPEEEETLNRLLNKSKSSDAN
jgi:hypothetical protein